MQEYKQPPCLITDDNRIGSGGNGNVGLVSNFENEKVIKIFSVNKKLSKGKRDRRYKRFCREIEVQRELSREINGILPVFDAGFPEEFSIKEPAWYTMPRADKFVVRDDVPLIKKLQRMLELAEILKQLHEKGMAHRDLKPENLLIFNGQICLADYGLVWIDGEESITQPTERLGPIKIMPPELEEREEIQKCDYTKSDVYLFAKVVWMYVKEDNFGYRGEYSRNDPQRYLSIKSNNGKTLEPLHQLMEKTSKHDWSKRPSISECMNLIKHQILILTGSFPKEKEREYSIKEKLSSYKTNVKPDVEVYEGGEKVLAFLKNMVQVVKLKVEKEGRTYFINPYLVRMPQTNLFVFSQEEFGGDIKRYAMHIHRLEFSEVKIKIVIEKLNQQERDIVEMLNVEIIDKDCEGEIILESG